MTARQWSRHSGLDTVSRPLLVAGPGDHQVPAHRVLATSFFLGAVPFSGAAAWALAGVDLRKTGSGTVSGSGLYEAAGFGPLAVAGSFDVAKGAVGPLLAGKDRPFLAVASAGLSLVGHNWSPFLGGAGGRGISPALGATLVLAPEATVLLGLGLGVGRLVHQSGLGTFIALASMIPVLTRRRGWRGAALASAIAVPMLAKRVVGNRPPGSGASGGVLVSRLLFDRDEWPRSDCLM